MASPEGEKPTTERLKTFHVEGLEPRKLTLEYHANSHISEIKLLALSTMICSQLHEENRIDLE